MKKGILVLFILISFVFAVFAQEAGEDTQEKEEELPQTGINTPLDGYDKDCKIQYLEKGGYWFINGFSFEHYNPNTDPGLDTLVNNEVAKVQKFSEQAEGHYVVGHSQGGPSALAYATKYKEAGYDMSRLKGVVTVSGIDRGLKALEGGFGPLKARVTNDVDILHQGLLAAAGIIPFVEYISLFGICLTDYSNQEILKEIINILPVEISYYVRKAWYASSGDNLQQLYDMMPGSDFIKTNVVDSQQIRGRKQTGTKLEWYWKKVGLIKVPLLRQVPVYGTYTAYIDKAEFPDEVPVAYIVGLDSNTLGMLGDEEAETREMIESCGEVFTLFSAINGIEAIAAGVTLNAFNANLHAMYSLQCANAAAWCFNIDDEIKELLNANENDGLVAKESQYITRQHEYTNNEGKTEVINIHSKMLGKDQSIQYYGYSEYNHMNIDPKKNEVINERIMNLIRENTDSENNK